MSLWANDGQIDHEDSMRCIELLGKEVLPALRDKAKAAGLVGPFEVDELVGVSKQAEEDWERNKSIWEEARGARSMSPEETVARAKAEREALKAAGAN